MGLINRIGWRRVHRSKFNRIISLNAVKGVPSGERPEDGRPGRLGLHDSGVGDSGGCVRTELGCGPRSDPIQLYNLERGPVGPRVTELRRKVAEEQFLSGPKSETRAPRNYDWSDNGA